MNLSQTFILVPGTVMHYDCVYIHSMSFMTFFKKTTFSSPVNEWIVHVGRCLT